MASTIFLIATTAIVGLGVLLRRLLPSGGLAALPLQTQAE